MHEDLHDAIRGAAEAADFGSLFDHFAEDIELRISVTLESSTNDASRGRRSVIRRLQRLYGSAAPTSEQPVDMFASGDRIVACRSASFAIAGGLTVHDACAFVFDVRDGRIHKLAIHHELSTLLGPASRTPAAGRRDNDGRVDRALSQTTVS